MLSYICFSFLSSFFCSVVNAKYGCPLLCQKGLRGQGEMEGARRATGISPCDTSPPTTVTLRFVPDRVKMFFETMGLPDPNGSKLPSQLLSLGLTLHDIFRRVLMP